MHFSELPDEARVRIPEVLRIVGESRSSYYSGAKRHERPPIEKLSGGRSSGVRVGELRRFLKSPSGSYRAPTQAAA